MHWRPVVERLERRLDSANDFDNSGDASDAERPLSVFAVGETLEAAEAGARQVDVHYAPTTAKTPVAPLWSELDRAALAPKTLSQRAERAHVAMPTAMRAPVEGPGLWALESAMDELAVDLGVDPLDLRLANYADECPAIHQAYHTWRLRQRHRPLRFVTRASGSKAAHIASMSTTTFFRLVCLSLDTTFHGSFA
jgi:CO/xanthine dehydrogenase Mo-binding subunit